MIISVSEREQLLRWQEYVDRHPGARAVHHSGWYGVLADSFSVRPNFFMELDETGAVKGVLPTYLSRSPLTGSHVASLDDGFLVDSPDVAHRLVSAAVAFRDQARASYFLLRTANAVPLQETDGTVERPTVRRIIATTQEPDALFSSLNSYMRRDIRRAEKRGYEIIHDAGLTELDRVFYAEYARQLRRLGTPVMSRRMMTALRTHLGPKVLRLYLVARESEIVGGMLCIAAPSGWTAMYAALRHELSTDYANYLLYWHAIKEAALAQADELDLGRNTPGSGVYEFKKKWTGEDRHAGHHYFVAANRSAPDVAVYQGNTLKQRIWKNLPLTITNRVGPVLRAQLPFG